MQLGHFIENKDFMPEVKECCPKVVNAAIAVYYKMCNAMLPTPNKSHYTFNLRDMSAVIKGVLQVLRFVRWLNLICPFSHLSKDFSSCNFCLGYLYKYE